MSQTTVCDDEFVAFRVRYELERQEKPARVLVRALGVTDNYISRRLTGKVPFSAGDLGKVADVLHVEVSVFYPQNPS